MAEIQAEDYNCNIRRYVDNAPPPEPHDVRAHLHGGVPVTEVDALAHFWHNSPSLRESCFTPRAATYADFTPALANQRAIADQVAQHTGVQRRQAQFMQQLGGWSKNEEQLDLRELLNQNFLCYDGKELVPEQIHAYLSSNWKELRNLPKDDFTLVAKACDRWYLPDPTKVGDLEKLREKALLKEFDDYKQVSKKLKVFRLEAVRAGFKKCWQERDYATIVAVADKIPNNVLEEDPKLLMWYDQAVTRIGAE